MSANIYKLLNLNKTNEFDNPNPLGFQHPFRAIVLGATGSGKSSCALNQLLGVSDGKSSKRVSNVSRCVLFTGSSEMEDPLYDELKKLLTEEEFAVYALSGFPAWLESLEDEVEDFISNQGLTTTDLPQTLVIIDDWISADKFTKASFERFLLYARKASCSLMFLVQSYTEIPIVIRSNCQNFILMTGLPSLQIAQVHRRISSSIDIRLKDFQKLYLSITNGSSASKDILERFLVIESNPNIDINKRMRAGYTNFINMDSFTSDDLEDRKQEKKQNKKVEDSLNPAEVIKNNDKGQYLKLNGREAKLSVDELLQLNYERKQIPLSLLKKKL